MPRYGVPNFSPADIAFDRADPNAGMLKTRVPTGGAIDVPALLLGIGIRGLDLGIWNGLTQPRLGVMDLDRDSWVALGFNANNDARILIGGASVFTMPAFIAGGDINLGANRLLTTNLIMKQITASIMGMRNAADDTYTDLRAMNLRPNNTIIFETAIGMIYAGLGADGSYVSLNAWDTGVGWAEIARMEGAAEPRLGHTLPLNLRSAGARTIAAGVITVGVAAATAWYSVDTEAAAATDDLDTINGGATGDCIWLKAANSARTVVVKHATGNLRLNGQADFSLDHADDIIALIFDGTNWLEFARSSNGI